jgi:hypothetical protein
MTINAPGGVTLPLSRSAVVDGAIVVVVVVVELVVVEVSSSTGTVVDSA